MTGLLVRWMTWRAQRRIEGYWVAQRSVRRTVAVHTAREKLLTPLEYKFDA